MLRELVAGGSETHPYCLRWNEIGEFWFGALSHDVTLVLLYAAPN